MSPPSNPDIIDATKLVFGFDMDGFRPWSPEEVEAMNASHPDDPSSFLGLSDRTISTFDEAQECIVMASEMYGSGQLDAHDEIRGAHLVALLWEDGQETSCFIDLDTGEVCEVKGTQELVDINLDENPEWRKRIIKALSELAEVRLGL